MSIIENVRINQFGKEEKKSSFIYTEQRDWELSEEKVVAPDGYEHLPANFICTAVKWLIFATEHNWKYYDVDGNPLDLQDVGKNLMDELQKYFKV